MLEKNGSIFIKLGQHLAAMGYLLPYEWTTTFVPLQDRCPVSSIESIEKVCADSFLGGWRFLWEMLTVRGWCADDI